MSYPFLGPLCTLLRVLFVVYQIDNFGKSCRAIRKVPDAAVIHLTTSRGCKIVAAWLPYNAQCRATLLFSHGNAVDLGLMLPFYRYARSPLGRTPTEHSCIMHAMLTSQQACIADPSSMSSMWKVPRPCPPACLLR